MKKLIVALAASAALSLPTVSSAQATYVSSQWGNAGVAILGPTMNVLSTFGTPGNPNGVAANGSTIFVGFFTTQSVIGYDHSGTQQFQWFNGALNGLQGLALVGTNLAVAANGNTMFFDAYTGAYQYQFANSGGTVEGLTYDGSLIWELGDDIIGRDAVTGSVVRSFANAAGGCSYGGTGIASAGAGALMLGCAGGEWYKVSDTDGSVIASGNNGLDMFGLDNIAVANSTVPEPSTYALMAAGLAGIFAARRRRKA